ncbi:neuroligin-4, Y-linked-like [Littorina saxatilis]|uniref:neuroligin-4, Y-linked-like n=1 Tax=Littorina saxatilis TaxID=31220 RepID=UPI0038B4F196
MKKQWSVYILTCMATVLTGVAGLQTVLVNTTYGTLRGVRTATADQHSFVDSFHNIPYARPPVGDLRFEKPSLPQGWSGVRDATKPGAQCPQRHRDLPPSRVFLNNEDCLYLNVYRPQMNSTQHPLPVMVWIHGGSYYVSTGNYYDGRQLASKGVIVVTINYRLDALGFLSTENDVSPGNYGLWDMIQALQWVHGVISAFNGDPNSVTIFGESSGSTSVSLLVLSHAALGLFHKAIMESGVSLTTWAAAHRHIWPEPRNQATALATRLGCDTSDSGRMLACLKTKDAMEIVNITTHMEQSAGDILFRPVIEATFGQRGLFSDTPRAMLQLGSFNKVTAMRGFNKFESSSVSDPEDDGITLAEFKQRVHDLTRWYVNRYSSLSDDVIEALLLDAYITKPNITDPQMIREAALQLSTDYGFVAPTIQELDLTTRVNPNPQYLYEFSYRSANRESPVWNGAEHADELHYVFGSPVNNDFMWNGFVTSWTDDDRRVSDDVMTLWTNFAKYGNPTPSSQNGATWLPWTRTSPNYLEIGETYHAMTGYRNSQLSVWTDKMINSESVGESIIG